MCVSPQINVYHLSLNMLIHVWADDDDIITETYIFRIREMEGHQLYQCIRVRARKSNKLRGNVWYIFPEILTWVPYIFLKYSR